MNPLRKLAALLPTVLCCACGSKTAGQPGTALANAASGDSSWQRYQDPLEQAFTLEVPRGWTVKGGMFRLGYSDHRVMVDMTSPDVKANIRFGDVAVPTYFLPNQFHHEGEIYDLGEQAQGRVARYRSGKEFAQGYSKTRFAKVCQSLAPQSSGPMPSLEQSLRSAESSVSTGDVTYACGGAQGERTAYVLARTQQAGGLWQAITIVSFAAPRSQVPVVQEMAAHAMKSFQLSLAWITKQKQLDDEALVYQKQRQQARMRTLSLQVAQFEQSMQAMRNQVASFERGQAQRQAQFQQMDNIISGITPTTDPYGNSVSVFNGPKSNYYRNPATGAVVNSDQPPGPGWDLLRLQR